jgi:hypothetical protein
MLSRYRHSFPAFASLATGLLLLAPSRVGAQVARLEPGPRPTVADAAPDFELETVDGLPFRLFEAAAGRPVVLQFAGCT